MWKASLYSPHFPLDLIEDMTPWTSCIGEHFPTSVSFLIFLARPMILAKSYALKQINIIKYALGV